MLSGMKGFSDRFGHRGKARADVPMAAKSTITLEDLGDGLPHEAADRVHGQRSSSRHRPRTAAALCPPWQRDGDDAARVDDVDSTGASAAAREHARGDRAPAV